MQYVMERGPFLMFEMVYFSYNMLVPRFDLPRTSTSVSPNTRIEKIDTFWKSAVSRSDPGGGTFCTRLVTHEITMPRLDKHTGAVPELRNCAKVYRRRVLERLTIRDNRAHHMLAFAQCEAGLSGRGVAQHKAKQGRENYLTHQSGPPTAGGASRTAPARYHS
jgi:hypothetical protein